MNTLNDQSKLNYAENTNESDTIGEEITTRDTTPPTTPPDAEEDDKQPKSSNPRPWPDPSQYLPVQRVFALLIAIDRYDMPGANLGGCVKDSLAVEQYLRENTEGVGERLHLLRLRSPLDPQNIVEPNAPAPASISDGQPTRQGMIDAFQGFLAQARRDDVILVHYSGHGSFETRPQELWHLDPEESSIHRAETIVCQDSFTTQNGAYVPPLRDKELRWLLAGLAKQNPHIVLLMDCCNSSGNTRFKEEGTLARFTPAVDAKNNIASYLFYQQDAAARATLDQNPGAFFLPEGRHVALYACQSYQLAKEASFPEGRFGVFTYFLLQTLRATKGNISYRDLLKLVRNKAAQAVAYQSPQWHCAEPKDADLVFMGGTAPTASIAYTLTPTDNPKEGRLDAGTLHGLLAPEAGPTYFSVFASDVTFDAPQASKSRQAILQSVAPDHSILTFTDGGDFPADTALLKAVVSASPLTKTKVCLELEVEEQLVTGEPLPNTEEAQRMGATLAQLQEALANYPYLEVVDKATGGWQYRLFVYRYQGLEKLRITEKDKVDALITPKLGWTPETLKAFLEEMTHIAKWERTLGLENLNTTILQPGLVSLEAIDGNGLLMTDHGGEITLANATEGMPKPKLKFKVVLHRPIAQPIYCALLHLRPDFGVNPSLLPEDAHLGAFDFTDGNGRIRYEKMEIYAGSHIAVNGQTNPEGLYLEFSLPANAEAMKIKEVQDHFKLIVSTEQFDPLHLWQNSLERSQVTRAGRPPVIHSALDSLLQEVQTRDAGWAEVAAEPPQELSDWWATTITVKTTTP